MDIFELLKNGKKAKWIAIGVVIAVVFLFVLFPIFSKFFEDTVSSEAISQTAIKGISTLEGGNNYLRIQNGSDEEDLLIELLSKSELWNTSIQISRDYQLLWYETLSGYLERTYLNELKSGPRKEPSFVSKSNYSSAPGNCSRQYTGDYANDECDFNGPVTNYPALRWDGGTTGETCNGQSVHWVKYANWRYYKSSDEVKQVGGKILGLYPDVLANVTLANTYSTLDQNTNKEDENISKIMEQYMQNYKKWKSGEIYMPTDAVTGMISTVKNWFQNSEKAAVINNALDDTFDEGSIYSTFDFSMGSECEATDVFGYYQVPQLPCNEDIEGDPNKKIKSEYECVLNATLLTDCKKEEKKYKDDKGNEHTEIIETEGYSSTDGNPDTYYHTYENNQIGPKATNKYTYADTKFSSDKKTCDYIWDGGELAEPYVDGGKCLRKHNGPFYEIKVEWICSPKKDKTIKGVTCNPIPKMDERGQIMYYYCGDVDINEIRNAIVDPIFNAYESNSLAANDYMTYDTVVKYIYPDTEEGNAKKASVYGQINPEGYKIDDKTRDIVAKHISLEITGGIEGRKPVICDKNGNFALQSFNRVLNPKQYEDSLKSTLTDKDNILRKNDPDKLESEHYSEKIFGVFYSEYNKSFDDWTPTQVEQQKRLDVSKKNSLIIEIFSTYEYITGYLLENGSTGMTGGAYTSGSGLDVADACGYSARTSAPTSSTTNYDFNATNYGECAWYAYGRVNEILQSVGSTKKWTTQADGNGWCYLPDAQTRTKVTDYTKPKKGSIVSWSKGDFGHVAIVEDVFEKDGQTWVTISQGGLGFGGVSQADKKTLWYGGLSASQKISLRQSLCGANTVGCFNIKTMTVDQLNTYAGKFLCYVYLLNDNEQYDDKGNCINPKSPAQNTSNNISNNTDNNNNQNQETKPQQEIEYPEASTEEKKVIIDYLKQKQQGIDQLTNIVNFYNYLIQTEGGSRLSESTIYTENVMFGDEKVTGTIEVSSYASANPGMYVGTLGNKSDPITINGKTYTFDLCNGCNVPRWFTYYKYLEAYSIHKNNAVSKLGNLASSATKVHTIMRLSWTYGPYHSIIDRFIDEYNKNGYEGAWCNVMSKMVYGNGGKLIGNYFNLSEMMFDLFVDGVYSENRGYKNYKYYNNAYASALLRNAGSNVYSVGFLETAISTGQFPTTSRYSCGY